MRKLTKRTQYSLRPLYALSWNYGRGPTLISRLSKEQAIPRKFLELLLLRVEREWPRRQQEGKGVGYYLAQQPDRITVGSVIRMIDGSLAPLPCASETRFRKCEEFLDIETCESLGFSRRLG